MGAAELLEVQRLDDRLADLRQRAAALEGRLRGSAELVRARREAAARQGDRQAADEAVEAADRLTAELRRRARTLERQLYGGSVRNPSELMTLDREFAEVRQRLAAEEEEELRRMEAAELATAAEREAAEAVAAIEQRRADQAGPDSEELERLRAEIEATVEERRLAASRRSAAEMRLYERLAARLHPAVARLLGDTCAGCRVAVSIHERAAVRAREGPMVQCPTCDRILAP